MGDTGRERREREKDCMLDGGRERGRDCRHCRGREIARERERERETAC